MPRPHRGEVWMVDLGLAAKARPCLLLTDWPSDEELALITVLAHTSTLRGIHWELALPKTFLREGAFHLQQISFSAYRKTDAQTGRTDSSRFRTHRNKIKATP